MTDEGPTGRTLSEQPPRRRPVDVRNTRETVTAALSARSNAGTTGTTTGTNPMTKTGTPAGTPAGRKAGRKAGTNRLGLAGLLALGAVPLIAGAVRLTELTGGAEVTPENARFFAAPLPLVLHIVSVNLYAFLGAFQFATRLRVRRPGWHRVAGRILVPSGLVAALTGLWMTVSYPHAADGSDLLSAIRLVFGTVMIVAIVLGVAAIRRRDIARHRAWMIRAYAIGVGAGTQALILLPWSLIFGTPGKVATALLLAAGWVLDLAVAERIIRGRWPVRLRS